MNFPPLFSKPIRLSRSGSLALLAIAWVTCLSGKVHAQVPGNDLFKNGYVLSGTGGQVIGNNFNASLEINEPMHGGDPGGSSVWYKWKAPSTGNFVFDTVGSDFSTILAFYTGTVVGSLTAVTDINGNPVYDIGDGFNGTSRLVLSASSGVTYDIAIDGVSGAEGNIVLNWHVPKPPNNDNFEKSMWLPGGVGSKKLSNVDATLEPGEVWNAGVQGGASVWFSWIAPNDGTYEFDTIGSAIDTTLGVYQGLSPDSVVTIASDDNSGGNGAALVTFSASKGDSFMISVDGVAGAMGNFNLQYNSVTAPANDMFASPHGLSGTSGVYSQRNLFSTEEDWQAADPEYLLANDPNGGSVWYAWTVPSTGSYWFSTDGSDFPSPLAIYTGTSSDTLTMVNEDLQGGNVVVFNANAGDKFRIMVDAASGAMGNIRVSWGSAAPPSNDNIASAAVISGSAGTISGTNSFATKEDGEPYHAGNAGGASVWYRWTPAVSGRYAFSTTKNNFQTLLAVYSGTTMQTLTPMGSDDGSEGSSFVAVSAIAGQTYSIAVDGYAADANTPAETGTMTLKWAPYFPTIQFANATYRVNESSKLATITVTRSGDVLPATSVVYSGSGGTAVAGVNYTPVSGTLSFAANQTTATFTVPVRDSKKVDGLHTVFLALKSGTDAIALGTLSKATLTIVDSDNPGGIFQFSPTAYACDEGDGDAVLTVSRSAGFATRATVRYSTANGTAIGGLSYIATSGSLTFGVGQKTATIRIPLINDLTVEANREFTVTLATPSAGVLIGASDTATVTVIDDDNGNGVFEFATPHSYINETSGTASIVVKRMGGAFGATTVNYSTVSGGTALPNVDFVPTSGTLTFAAGKTTATILLPIFRRAGYSPTRTVLLQLTNPSGGATLGAKTTETLSICDVNNPYGVLQVDSATYNSNTKRMMVNLTRIGGLTGYVTAHFATADGTAAAGVNYGAKASTVTFVPGQSKLTVAIPVISLGDGSADLNFMSALSNTGGGASLGANFSKLITLPPPF